jgi:hypothetical protein
VDEDDLARLLRGPWAAQAGVVTRRQLYEAGAAPHDVRRLVRRRLLVPVHDRVFVDHTGTPTWEQRTWAAVLATGPGSALCHGSWAPGTVVHVAIDVGRRIREPPGVRVHRVTGLAQMVRWTASPPRVRPEHDVLLLLDRTRDEDEVVELLATAVRSRVTTAARIRAAVAQRTRLRHRRLVLAVLDDVERGTHSVLEWRYLRDVERAHGLPPAVWQQRRSVRGRTEYADATYPRQRLRLELRGRLGHDSWEDRATDARRDLDQAAAGWQTIEIVHRQVFRSPCTTAARLGETLRRLGWTGSPRPCRRPDCVIAEPTGHRVTRALRDQAG